MAIVYLGLGANLGNRRKNIKEAVRLLEKNGINILKHSRIIETEPLNCPAPNRFLNAVVKASTNLSPQNLLKKLKLIEKQSGRKKTITNAPRPIDLDILLYDGLYLQNPSLTIPHPRMFQRGFIMNPLKEIAPDLVEELINANN